MWEKTVEALAFFVGDYIKIVVLLVAVIFVMAVVRSFIYPDRIKQILKGKNEYAGNALAAVFGIFTPF